jgi:general secretion pathway protein K
MRIARQTPPKGIALIIVMLVIVVLGLMAAGFSYSMKVETRLAQNVASEAELLWLGRSGVELAGWYLAEKDRDPAQAGFDCLAQRWAHGPGIAQGPDDFGLVDPLSEIPLDDLPLGRGIISVEIIDQERRFNINRASREILEKAMELLGVASLDADVIVDSIEDWKDPNDEPLLNGAESEYYLFLPEPKGPHLAKNGPIEDLSELAMVQGVTPELVWGNRNEVQGDTGAGGEAILSSVGFTPLDAVGGGLLSLADLFNTSGGAMINLNTASRAVLQLLPGMDENLADAIVLARAGLDGQDGTEDDTPYQRAGELINVGGMPPQYVGLLSRVCTVRSTTFEIRVRARVDQYERTYVAIVTRPVPGRGMTVMRAYWE